MRVDHPWGWLAAITLVALGTRLVGLNSGLWLDEILSLVDSFRVPFSQAWTVFPGDTQHPLHALLANLCHSAFGESAWAVRLPAALFGVASVPMLYLLGREIVDQTDGLLAAGLLAVSYHHVWFSQNARGYTMLLFFALLSTWLLIRGLKEGSRRLFVGYGLAIALGVYTHVTMAFLVAAQVPVALLASVLGSRGDAYHQRGGGSPASVLMGFAIGVAMGALLYLPIFTQVLDFFLNTPSQLEGVSTPGWALDEAVRVLRIGFGATVGLVAAGTLVSAGLLSYLNRAPLALALFVVPGFTTLFGALLARGTMYPRFFFFLAGFGILIAVRGARALGEWVGRRLGSDDETLSRRLGVAAGLVMIAGSAVTLRSNYVVPKQDYRGASEYVEESAGPNDEIVTTGVTAIAYRDYLARDWSEVREPEDVRALTNAGRRVWLLYSFPRYLIHDLPRLAPLIEDACAGGRVFPGTVGGGEVVVCTFEPTNPVNRPQPEPSI